MDATCRLTNHRRYYHPLPIFFCFISILVLLVLIPHPLMTTLSLITAQSILVVTKQWRWSNFLFSLLLYLMITFTNPIFVTKGATVLFYCFDAPYTLEALFYGAVFANMIVSLLTWCMIFNQYLTSDHIVYLFSKPFKVLALSISIIFRLIPKFKKQMQEILLYQKKLPHKTPLKRGLDAFLTMITWSFESSLEMVNSMNARGYRAKRTHFHLFIFKSTDLILCFIILFIDISLLIYYFIDFSQYYFYPLIKPISFNWFSILSYMAFIVLLLIPNLFKKEEEDA